MNIGKQTGKNIWYGPDISQRKAEWHFTLTSAELEELEKAADILVNSSNTLENDNQLSLLLLDNFDSNFELPLIKSRVSDLLEILHNGFGFAVLSSIPVQTWTRERTAAAFLLIGQCMGNLRQQNAQGHVLGHVKDLGLSTSNPNVRVYQTKEPIPFHADFADVVGLLCLKAAKSGGLSSLVSTGTIFNEMLGLNPGLAHELCLPFPTDKRGEVPKGTLPFRIIPVYNYYEGYLSSLYFGQYIHSSQRHLDAPRLTEQQLRALKLFDSLANDPQLHFSMDLQPGDIQFVHNHNILHARSGFEEDPFNKRHLLRIWLATPNARPLPPELFGSSTVGDRGGICLPGVVPIAPMDA